MKRILTLIVIFFSFAIAHAGEIGHIVFFGDSLTDDGNLYNLAAHHIPKSPPYFMGRFTNGYTWAEDVGKFFYNHNYIDYKIYAYGGATALPTPLISLDAQIKNYLDDVGKNHLSVGNTLFVIWIGANDYLGTDSPDPSSVDEVVNSISSDVSLLIDKGASHFLILNLPNLGETPFAKSNQITKQLQNISQLHNQKLQSAMRKLETSHPYIKFSFFDVYATFESIVLNLSNNNAKYHVDIQNIDQACWSGGMTLQEIKYSNNLPLPREDFLHHSTELVYVSAVDRLLTHGIAPCANAENYIFWDEIHPTEVTHQILAQLVIENLMQMMA